MNTKFLIDRIGDITRITNIIKGDIITTEEEDKRINDALIKLQEEFFMIIGKRIYSGQQSR